MTTMTPEQRKLNGANMELGRARTALIEVKAKKGARLADGLDCAEINVAVSTAEQQVAELELTVETLKQRALDAAIAQRQAAKQAEAEMEYEILSQLQTVGLAVDAQIAAVGTLVNGQLIPLLNAARSLPNDGIRTQLTNAAMSFKHRLLGAVSVMPQCANMNQFLSKEPWSASLPKPTTPNVNP